MRPLALSLLALAVACQPPTQNDTGARDTDAVDTDTTPPADDSGSRADDSGTSPDDSGRTDDSGATDDSGTATDDSGRTDDSGPTDDSGQTDDSGATDDSGTPTDDSGATDTGVSVDTGAPDDSGATDTGVSLDTGPAPDDTATSRDTGSTPSDTDTGTPPSDTDTGAVSTDTGTPPSDTDTGTPPGDTDTGPVSIDTGATPPDTGTPVVDADADGWAADADCDDADADVHPGAVERCDDVDDDCDGLTDEDGAVGALIWHPDADGDGYGGTASSMAACEQPSGYVFDDNDCDDTEPDVFPGATETCDGEDDDCDGTVDDGAIDAGTWYADADGDGYGDAATSTTACTQPSGWLADATDCDDTDAAVHAESAWYRDADGDTWGDGFDSGAAALYACHQPSGYVANALDCDDTLSYSHTPYWYYVDADGDGQGDPDTATRVASCAASMAGYAQNDDDDCDDGEAAVYDGAPEVCGDGLVNDCAETEADAIAACDTWGSTIDSSDSVASVATDGGYDHAVGTGDVDADGQADVVISSTWDVPPGAVSESDVRGAARVFPGPRSGDVAATTGTAFADADTAGYFGVSLAVGDVDGDGAAEVLVGSPWASDAAGGAGAAYLFTWSGADQTVSDAWVRADGPSASQYAGDAVAILGDQDGDGDAEIVVGGQAATGAASGSGAAWVLDGDATGTASLASADATLSGATGGDHFGGALEAADLDGDGTEDLVVGAWSANQAYLFEGPVRGSLATSDADATISGTGMLGFALASGDDDGDGTLDLYVAAPNLTIGTGYEGELWLFRGPVAGTLATTDAAASIQGVDRFDRVGGTLSVDDLDLDGSADLLFTHGFAYYSGSTSSFGSGEGDARLFMGPLAASATNAEADVTVSGAASASFAGDIDGDGWDDLIYGDAMTLWTAAYGMY